MKVLCEVWNMTPVEAMNAPVWVLRDTAILSAWEDVRPKGD